MFMEMHVIIFYNAEEIMAVPEMRIKSIKLCISENKLENLEGTKKSIYL